MIVNCKRYTTSMLLIRAIVYFSDTDSRVSSFTSLTLKLMPYRKETLGTN